MLNTIGNGNSWLCIISGSPTTAYNNSYGQGIMNVGFDYVEIGDSNSQSDLYNSGIISQES